MYRSVDSCESEYLLGQQIGNLDINLGNQVFANDDSCRDQNMLGGGTFLNQCNLPLTYEDAINAGAVTRRFAIDENCIDPLFAAIDDLEGTKSHMDTAKALYIGDNQRICCIEYVE